MIRFALAALVTSSVGAAFLFSACSDSTFTATSGTDARADGEISDASPGDSADSSAVAIADAGRIFPIICVDGGHTICDTFDEAKVSDLWTVNSACSAPSLDTAKSVSAPSSLSTSDVNPGSNCASVYSGIDDSSSTKFTSSFDVLVDTPNAIGAPFFAIWLTTHDDAFYEIALTTDAMGTVSVVENLNVTVDSGSTVNVTPLNGANLVQNAWNKVTIELDITTNDFAYVTVNDGDKVSALLEHRPTPGSVSQYRVYLGVPNGGDTKAAAHFDDFVCDVTP